MKLKLKCNFGLQLLTFAFLSAFARAQTDAAREFSQLQDQRQKALAAAAEPINRRYQMALDQLLKRATFANDLETAVKIKAEMESIGSAGSAPTDVSGRSLEAFLPGTRWSWFDTADLSGPPHWIELYKDGKGLADWGGMSLVYQITPPSTLKISEASGAKKTWYFTVDIGKRQALPHPTLSDGRDPKSLKLEKRVVQHGP